MATRNRSCDPLSRLEPKISELGYSEFSGFGVTISGISEYRRQRHNFSGRIPHQPFNTMLFLYQFEEVI
jgi:hypothetical protein